MIYEALLVIVVIVIGNKNVLIYLKLHEPRIRNVKVCCIYIYM